ncbi:MAG: efflux RND transporter permease subunit, partial [Pseudomonadota bacterium]
MTIQLLLAREAFPSITNEVAEVYVSWPGASPTEVEEQIILRIEEEVADIADIDEMTATAREGAGEMTITMRRGADFDAFLAEVKARVDGVSNLPQDSFPPIVRRGRAESELAFIVLGGDIDQRSLNRLARQYRNELASLPGGSPLVEVDGLRTEEVSIEVTETALRQYGLTFQDVSDAIRGASLNLSMGEVRTETGNIPLASRNLADTSNQFGAIVIRQNRDGSIVRVRDVATVIDGFPDRNYRYEINGKPGVTLQVFQPKNTNIVSINEALENWIAEKQDDLPPGVQMEMQFSFITLYEGRLNLVSSNAMSGLALVLIILMLFLRPTVAFWVAAGIGVSFIGTFIFFPVVGVSLNMLSLFGLLLVIGIVVDDALVVGESINRQVELGKRDLEAAVVGTQIVAKPVVFAVLTTMLAFSPFIFIGGEFGSFLESISWTILFALTFSLIESFLILPAHLAHLKPQSDKGIMRYQKKLADGLVQFADRVYRPLIKKALRYRYHTVVGFLGFFSLAVALLAQGWVKFEFFPDVENPFLITRVTMQEGTAWNRQLQVYEQIQAADARLDEVLQERVGEDILLSTELRTWSGTAFGFHSYASADKRGLSMDEIGQIYRDLIGPIPDAESISISNSFGGPGNGRFLLEIESDNSYQASRASEDIQNFLRTVPILSDVRDNRQQPLDELRLKLKPGAERFGVTLADVAQQLRTAYYGDEVQRLPRDGQDVRVMVRYPEETRESLESLYSDFRIRTGDGREIPATSVVEFEPGPAVRIIRRTDRNRSIQISARIRRGSDAGPMRREFYGQVVPEITDRYPEVRVRPRGADEEQSDFFGQLTVLGTAALFGMYMLLAIAFGSYFQPILIMSAIPFGFMGAMFGHVIFGAEFAMFSFFGIAAAAGVVVNDNLVLVDYVNRLRNEGAGAFSALVEAGVVRFRPILLTSVTTFIGLLPIMFEGSLDAQFLKPVVISLAFGVLFALFVTLFFVPSMYAVGADISRWILAKWTGERQPKLGEGASASDLPDIQGSSPNAPAE